MIADLFPLSLRALFSKQFAIPGDAVDLMNDAQAFLRPEIRRAGLDRSIA